MNFKNIGTQITQGDTESVCEKKSQTKGMRILMTMLIGLKNTVLGTITAGLFAVSIAGFCVVPTDNGYSAVATFIAACLSLVVSIASMYLLGCPKKGRGGKYEKTE